MGFDQPPITVFAGSEVGMSLYQAPAWPAADGIAARCVQRQLDGTSVLRLHSTDKHAGGFDQHPALPVSSHLQFPFGPHLHAPHLHVNAVIGS